MAKRSRFSRWRRLPGVFRHGERKWADPNLEPTRLTLYLPGTVLDTADALASKAGVETVQDYCTELLRRAIEDERIREHVADIESRQGPLAGLNEIADDPEYLAEWNAQASARGRAGRNSFPFPIELPPPTEAAATGPREELEEDLSVSLPRPEVEIPEGLASEVTPDRRPSPPEPSRTPELTPTADVILRHAGQGDADPQAFLPSLRRGESAPIAEIAELARALQMLEMEYRNSSIIPRPVAYALHRLALESQVLHTDAFPGAYDEWTVDTIRAVQEAVDRVLSGQDIRYYSDNIRPEDRR